VPKDATRSSTEKSKTLPGADRGTDHELLIAEMKIKQKIKAQVTRPPKYNTDSTTNDYKKGKKEQT
jgi:hypothetical protein